MLSGLFLMRMHIFVSVFMHDVKPMHYDDDDYYYYYCYYYKIAMNCKQVVEIQKEGCCSFVDAGRYEKLLPKCLW